MTSPEETYPDQTRVVDFKTTKLTPDLLTPGTVLSSPEAKKTTDIDDLPDLVGKAFNTRQDLPLPYVKYWRLGGDMVEPQDIKQSEHLGTPSEILRTTADRTYGYKGVLNYPKATILNKSVVREETGFYADKDEFWDNSIAMQVSATGYPDSEETEFSRIIILHAAPNDIIFDSYILPTEEDPKITALMRNRNLTSAISAHNARAEGMNDPLAGGLPGQNS